MFCAQCGSSLRTNARFCSDCGQAISDGAPLRCETPSPTTESKGAIWNPNAAANWSILFTPAFGSLIHSINWRVLGNDAKAKAMLMWFYASIAILFLYVFMGVVGVEQKAAEGLALLFLIAWYFIVGRAQAKYVKANFGSSYDRRPWGKPLLISTASVLSFFAVIIVAGVVAESFYENRSASTDLDFSKYGTPVDTKSPGTKTEIDCVSNLFSDLTPDCPKRFGLSKEEYAKRKAVADVICRQGNYKIVECWEDVLNAKK